ncbi:peptidoglycan-recognition protein 2-like [Cylas formicarius]|uniref:peptidoglycan-recognition protein 2-like n=1 Tax=Cylas formicarius TaxID=197179 RepID=UPI002958BAB6|nr:peptidoglycan-recognition protein 2-like [Cylas formicarius]
MVIFLTLLGWTILIQPTLGAPPDWPKVCPEIISKTRWGARTPIAVDYGRVPTPNIVIHHTVTNECSTESACMQLLRSIQNFHIDTMEFQDIGYNFVIGGDGQVYEGAGWHKVGAHTRGYNTRSLGIGFIGNFSDKLPNQKMLTALRNFLQCGVELGEIESDYRLFAARQVSSTLSPGTRFYHELKNWPHFAPSP